jgi:hypothetical protein
MNDEDDRFKDRLILGALMDIAKSGGKPSGGEVLLDALGKGMNPSDAILAQEAREQLKVANEAMLPRYAGGFRRDDSEVKEWYTRMGIEIVGERDDLFFSVKLPEGWKIEPTEHSMYSNLLDNRGRSRASIFYKGAFYDRKASVSLNRRFTISKEYIDWEIGNDLPFYEDRKQQKVFCRVLDCEEEIFRTDVAWFGQKYNVIPDEDDRKACKKWHKKYEQWQQAQYDKCRAYLNEHWPDWEDEFAYWNDTDEEIVDRLGVE